MKAALVLLAVLFLSAGALAEDPPFPQTMGAYGAVPEPVPAGYEYCIAATASDEESRKKYGLLSIFPAPITQEHAQSLNYARDAGLKVLTHCNAERT